MLLFFLRDGKERGGEEKGAPSLRAALGQKRRRGRRRPVKRPDDHKGLRNLAPNRASREDHPSRVSGVLWVS